MPTEHYENFPVASMLLPPHLRPAVQTIYAFARSADDFADEGDASPAERLQALQQYEQELDGIAAGQVSTQPLFQALAAVMTQYQLPLSALRDLLNAFKQDVTTTRYADYASLLDYCRRSANPVGCLMLNLYGAAHPKNLLDSNAICSALQLINFWQDVAIDIKKQRIYIPLEDLQHFGLDERACSGPAKDPAWQALMLFQTRRAHALMLSGSGLAKRLPGRIGWELRLVVQGGLRIIEKIEAVDGDVFQRRPKIVATDWPLLLWRALKM